MWRILRVIIAALGFLLLVAVLYATRGFTPMNDFWEWLGKPVTIAVVGFAAAGFSALGVWLWKTGSQAVSSIGITAQLDRSRKWAYLVVHNTGKQTSRYRARMLKLIARENGKGEELHNEYAMKWAKEQPMEITEIVNDERERLDIARLGGIATVPTCDKERVELHIFPVQKEPYQVPSGISFDTELYCEIEVKAQPPFTKRRLYEGRLHLEGKGTNNPLLKAIELSEKRAKP